MVALLAGDFQAETRWMPGYAQSGRETGAQLSRQAAEQNDARALFFFADGFNGDADQLCNALSNVIFPLGGRSLFRGLAYGSFLPDRGSTDWDRRARLRRFCAANLQWVWVLRMDGILSAVSSV